jgi:hypothetical protein
VESRDPEVTEPAVDDEAMKAIAKRSGGASIPIESLAKLGDILDQDTVRQFTDTESIPLRRQNFVPVVFIVLLTVEWVLRKRFRML